MAEKYSSLVFVVLLAMESAFGVASNTTMPTGGTTSAAAIMIAGNTTATFTTRTTAYRPFTTTVLAPVPSYPTTTTPPQGSNTAPPVHTVKPVLKVFGKIALLWFNQSLTFHAAQNSCISHQARLLHNATLSSLYFNYAHAFFLPISSFKNDQGSVRPTQSLPRPPTFWYISGAYNTTALQYNNGTCEMWVSGFNYRPCNHTATYFCMRKIPDCYPEMGEACDVNQRCVVYLNGSAGCACNQGYTKTPASSCRDINECRTRPRPCSHRRSTCRNYEGGYTCVCPTGLVGVVCGYKITMQQLLKGLIYKPLMSNRSSYTYKRHAHDIIKSLKRTTKKYILSIRGLELVEMLRTGNSTTIIYDVYTMYKSVTSSTVLEFFKESKRRNGPLFLLYNADLPSQAPPICYRGFVKSTWENRTLEFPATPAGVTSFNIGACVTEDWYALIQCRRPTTIGHSPYFDRHTLMRRPCGQGGVVPVMAPNESVGKKAVTTRVDQTLQLIAALSRLNSTWPPTSSQPASPLPTSSPPASSQPTSTIIGQLTDDVIKYNVTIKPSTMICLMVSISNLPTSEPPAASSPPPQQDVLLQSLSVFAAHLDLGRSGKFEYSTPSIKAMVQRSVPTNHGQYADVVFVDSNSNKPIRALVPSATMAMVANKSHDPHPVFNVAFFLHRDNSLFPPSSNVPYKPTQVLSAQINLTSVKRLQQPFQYNLPLPDEQINTKRIYRCGYWNVEAQDWMFDGCQATGTPGDPECLCDHMTNFGLLVQTIPSPPNFSLQIFGKVCLSISIVCFGLIIIIHLKYESLRRNKVIQIHTNLTLCLMVGDIVFLAFVQRPRSFFDCVVVAGLIHYFMLSAWGWMVVECVTMYRMFVRVFHAIGSNYVLKSGLAVYVTSGLVFGVTIGVTRGYFDNKDYGGWLPEKLDENPSYYISPQICWLHGSALRFGFMLPIALCFLTNCIGFFFVTRAITWGGTKIASTQSKRREGKQHLIRIVTITFLLGLTWFFAIPITVSTDQYVVNVFSWIFTIANTAQGVGMFFLFCVRREDVFKLWTGSIKQLFNKTSKTKDSTIFTGSNMKSTAGSDQMESTKSFDQRVIPSSEHEVDVTGIRSSTFHPKRTNEEEEVM